MARKADAAIVCTKFVDKNHSLANNANPGTEAQPWATLQHAASVAGAGDTVCVKQGTYNERLIPSNSGDSINWITFAAYPGHERLAIIDGTNVIPLPVDPVSIAELWNDGMISMSFKSYIRIVGFKVINSNGSGIYVGGGNNIIIEGNRVEHTGHAGIQLYGAGAVNTYIVTGNEINRHGFNRSDWEALSIARTNGFDVGYNVVYDPDPGILAGAKILIDAKDGSKNGVIHHNEVFNSVTSSMGIYVDAWRDTTMENIVIHSNKVRDIAFEGIAINVEVRGTLQNVDIYNNLVYNAGKSDDYGSGIVISSYAWVDPAETQPRIIRDIDIYNNTIYGSGAETWDGGGIIIGRETLRLELSNVNVKNNLLFDNNKFQIVVRPCACVTSVTVSDNLAFPFRGYTGEVPGTIAADPQFIDPIANNFHLKDISPAINNGVTLGAPFDIDYDGNARPVGAGYDIGAYEYGGVPPVCVPNGCGGGCPTGCIGANDPDCAGQCLDNTCVTDTDCVAPPTPACATACPGGCANIGQPDTGVGCTGLCSNNTGKKCSNGDLCLIENCQADGTCGGGVAKTCPASSVCTAYSCNSSNGQCNLTYIFALCNDNNVCTDNDACANGQCNGIQRNCADAEQCTSDFCSDIGGIATCQHVNACGGLMPCSRLVDNPTTTDINESNPCTLCAVFYILKNIINYIMAMAIGIGIFVMVLAGLLYATSAGDSSKISLAKSAVTSALAGMVIIFIAWLVIAVILQGMGYANMTTWNQVNCEL